MHCPYCNGLLMKCYSDFGGYKFSSDKCRCIMCGALFIIGTHAIRQIPFLRKTKPAKYPLFKPKTCDVCKGRFDKLNSVSIPVVSELQLTGEKQSTVVNGCIVSMQATGTILETKTMVLCENCSGTMKGRHGKEVA